MEESSAVLGSNGQESGWVSLSFHVIGLDSNTHSWLLYVTGRITVMERGERGEFLFVLFVQKHNQIDLARAALSHLNEKIIH